MKVVTFSVLLFFLFFFCKGKKDLQHYAGAKEKERSEMKDPYCPEKKEITNPKEDEPEYVIYQLYKSALGGDTDENFETFYSFFAETQHKDFVKKEHWPRIIKHVRKYVKGENDPSYVICRTDKLSEDRIRIFIKCNDPKKTNPPINLIKEDGKWKVDIFTP